MLKLNPASKMISKKPTTTSRKLVQLNAVTLPILSDREVMFSAKCEGLSVAKLVQELPSVTFFGPRTVQFRDRFEGQVYTVKIVLFPRMETRVFLTMFVKDDMLWKLEPVKIQLFEHLQQHVQQTLGATLNDWQVSSLENVMLPLSVTEDRVTKNIRKHGKMTVWGDVIHFILSEFPDVQFKFDFSVDREAMMRVIGSAKMETIHKAWCHLLKLIHL